jgi:PAT family beta-lactamase induction signal transducer AmpG
MINPFVLDPVEAGGLGMNTTQVGLVYGTIGIIGLTVGGILGGFNVSRIGLKRSLWPMALSLTLPCLVFCWMSMAQPDPNHLLDMILINGAVFIEQFGYGVGFTSFMLYMMYFAEGPSKTSHYAICTAFMALGMMLPGMFAGWIQQQLGYVNFFWWIMLCCGVTLAVTALIKVDPSFGVKQK